MHIERQNRRLHITGLPRTANGLTIPSEITVSVTYVPGPQARGPQARALSGVVLPLFAAAPDMLDALKEIVRNCESYRTLDNMAGRLCHIAEYAIRKAEGE